MSEHKPQTSSSNNNVPIAIVGVGCKLPGNVTTVEDLLATLRGGRDCISQVPSDRWNSEAYYDPDPLVPGKTYVRYGGFVSDINKFDAAFFGISEVEAARMDPQQRLLLETVWHALENAGQSSEELTQSNTGVFLAMMNTNGYSQLKGAFEGLQGVTAYDAMGDAMSITAGRISHFLGLEGPCLAVDTACSGSMVALHLARQSILAGECDSAIVAGVNAILHPGIHIAFSKVGLMSRSGRCRAFDESADGYIRGEGCVAVLIRRESEAIGRGDHILASIVGTAINQDGHTPALTAPNGRTQEKVIRMALARLGLDPSEIAYVEAHGTGTPVGDPIEMSALANVYGPGRSDQKPLFVGSVKSNFGHIEAGAGLLGIVKAALSLEHRQIFPSLHFKKLNPNIEIGQAPIRVPTEIVPWPADQEFRRAGVNSFGYSGTNAHTILQQAPSSSNGEAKPILRNSEIVVVSAKSAGGLEELADKWSDYLTEKTSPSLPNIAFTAATGRTHFRHRLAVVGQSKDDVATKLRSWRTGRSPKGLVAGQKTFRRKSSTAFVFTGQGSQYAEMGRELYNQEARFKQAIDRCAELMDTDLGVPLTDVLFGPSSAELLGNTRYVQPALFAIEYALSDLLGSWGIEPDFVIGHSVGEIVAATVAGVLDLRDAAKFVCARGRLMGQLPVGGKMLAVEADPESAREWIKGREAEVSIAAVNGPRSIVISGQAGAIEAVAELATAAGHRAKALEVSHAFHSPLMDPILDELTSVATSLHLSPARLPIVSNTTGNFFNGNINPEYWSSHVRQTVLFHQGISTIMEAGCSLLIEIGPHPVLTATIAASFPTAKTRFVPTLMRDKADLSHVLETLGAVYVIGGSVNLDRLFWSSAYRRVSLPLYPFRRDRHWFHSEAEAAPEKPATVEVQLHPLIGRAVSIGPHRSVFESNLTATPPWVDHRVLGSTVFPGTAYLEMAARGFAASKGEDWRAVTLKEVVFERPLVLSYGKLQKVSLVLEDLPTNRAEEVTFTIMPAAEEAGTPYCRGRISFADEDVERASMEATFGLRDTQLQIGPFYGELRKMGLEYGATFSTIRELWAGQPDSGDALGRISFSPNGEEEPPHPYVNSVLLDGCVQVFGAGLRTFTETAYGGAFVPASIQSMTLRRTLPSHVWSQVNVRTNGSGRAAVVRIRILSDDGEVLADIDGLELRQKSMLSAVSDEPGAAARVVNPAANTSESRDQLLERLRTLPKDQRVDVLAKWLASEVKDILGQAAEEIDLDDIDPSTGFVEIGLDSLLVTELQRRIQEKLEFRFEPMQGLDYQSIESLAEYILNEVLVVDPAASDTQVRAVGAEVA